jgi:histidinol-phosphatase (PHP family)
LHFLHFLRLLACFRLADEHIGITTELGDFLFGNAEFAREYAYNNRYAEATLTASHRCACTAFDAIDIVGHFDLITKFNEQKRLFDTDSPRYRAAARRAMERLVAAGKIFEINAGAMNRGYRTEPYPSVALLRQLREMGGKIILSSDAHSPQSVYGGFETLRDIALDCGFTEVWQYIDGAFRPQSL